MKQHENDINNAAAPAARAGAAERMFTYPAPIPGGVYFDPEFKDDDSWPPCPVTDSHCHIYPEKIAIKAVEAIENFYDSLTPDPHDGTTAALAASGNAAGITRFVVHSVATKPEQVSGINHFIARSVNGSGGAFIGLGAIHPDSADLEADFDELESLGLRGVKVHPDFQRFRMDDPAPMRVFEICEARKLPVLVHTGDYRYDFSNPDRVASVLRAFPDLRMIGAHFGGWSIWDYAPAVLADFPNLYVDTSSSNYFLSHEKAKETLRAYGSKRVMFGTDYPLWPQKLETHFLKEMDLTDDEYRDIFWDTCSSLFGE